MTVNRNNDGSYTLSHNGHQDVAELSELGWGIRNHPQFGITVRLSDLKAAWEYWAGRCPKEQAADEDADQATQRKINEAESEDSAIRAFVSAYNCETVALAHGKPKRFNFRWPRGVIPDPPLEDCYDPHRDQYTWPHRQEGH